MMQGTDDAYQLSAQVRWTRPETVRLDVRLYAENSGHGLETTVNISPGQALILGSSPKPGSAATLLLTVRADEVDSGGDL